MIKMLMLNFGDFERMDLFDWKMYNIDKIMEGNFSY